MPIPQIDNLLDVGRYTSQLPEARRAIGAAGVGPMQIPVEWAQRSIEAATSLSGHFLQGVGLKFGWPGDTKPLTDLVGLAQTIGATDDPLKIATAVAHYLANSDLLRAALEQPLQVVQAKIVDALAGVLGGVAAGAQIVPIIGWAILIIRSVFQAAKTVRENQEEGYAVLPGTIDGFIEAILPTFSRANDDDAANAMLHTLRTKRDWTEIWMPSTAGWGKYALDYDGNRRVDGWFFGANIVAGLATDIPMPGGTWSAIPGVAQLGGAFYGRFSSKGFEVRSISDLYPSVNQLAGLAWTYMQRPTGLCCAVDLKAIRHAWGIWQGKGGIEWLDSESMKPPKNDVDMAYLIQNARWMAGAALGNQYLDGRLLRSELYPGSDGRMGSRQHVRERVYEATAAMRDRIWRNLGTIACAYVPPDAPALRSDAELKLRYAAMRVALLKHSARYDVELDLVPDEFYRKALWESRMKLAAPDVAQRRRGGTLDGSPGPLPPQLPGVPGGGTIGGGDADIVGLLVLAALAAGAMLL